MRYDLPISLTVNNTEYEIRADFREILDVLEIINDNELEERERCFLALLFFYAGFDDMPVEDYQEALERCFWFINGGDDVHGQAKKQPKLMDWEKDFPLIIAPVNRVVGREIRSESFFHWWSFLAAYMEIGECTFAQVVHIRSEKSKGKKLSKFDEEYYRDNRDLIDLPVKYTDADNELFKRLGGV